MASVTVNLTGYNEDLAQRLIWVDDVSIGATFAENNNEQTLSSVTFWYQGITSGQTLIHIIGDDNRFTPAFEATGFLTVTASDGEKLTVQIANADMTEPYLWTPANSAEVTTFANHVRGLSDKDATLTLTDDPPATDHAVDGGNLEWGFALPEATVTHTPAPTATVPARPSQPSLVVDSHTQITATGVSPDDGGSPITSYDWRHRVRGSGGSGWVDRSNVTNLTQSFSGLDASTEYDFRFRATNDVGDSPYSFPVRETTDDAPPVTVDHTVDGGDLTWGFELPEATVTIVRAAGPTDHAINGGDLSWGFAIPQATVTLVRASGPVDHTVDGGSLSWGFYLPRARVTHSGIADYTLEVDWDNDGSYANANADVWGRVIEGTFRCRRGRNFASQRSGRSVAGSLEVQLDNRDGLLDPDNTPGALNGLLSGGRRVRWRMNDGAGVLETQWTGWLRTIEQIDRGSGLDRVRLRALGVISRLNPPRVGQQQQPVVIEQQTNITTQAAARLIFDPDGSIGSADAVVDGVDYRASYINGSRSMARWWAARPRLVELRDLEQTETGFLWEPKDGFVGMQGTAHRQQASAQIAQAIFVDTNPASGEIPAIANGIKPDHPYEDLANIITSQVRTYGVGVEAVLWDVEGFPISGGSDFSIVIRYPNENTRSNGVAVSSWTALAEGTDYDAQPGVTLTLTTDGNNATIRIQNVNVATTMDIQLRGIPVVRNSAVEIITSDQDSVDEHGPLPYPFDAPWISNPATVAVIHGILLRLYGQPAERLALTWEVESDRAKAASLDISERVEVMRRGEATEYFIESIRHRVTQHFHFVTMTLSPAGLYGALFVMGVSRYGEGVLSP